MLSHREMHMVKKILVFLSLSLLCSGVVKADETLHLYVSSEEKKDDKTPNDQPTNNAEALKSLHLAAVQGRAQAAKNALLAEMGDITAEISKKLTQSKSFGLVEFEIAKSAIAQYGKQEDRCAAVDKAIAAVEIATRAAYAQYADAESSELPILEVKIAELTAVKNGLIAAKNNLVTNSSSDETLLKYFSASNPTHKRVVEGAAITGIVSVVGVVCWGVNKLLTSARQ